MGTLATLATAFKVASTVVGAASAVSQGYAQSQSQKNQAAAAEYNARLAEQNAAIAASEASLERSSAKEAAYRSRGRLAAAQAQTGLLGSATAEAVASDWQKQAEEDQFKIQFSNQLERQGLLNEAANYRAQAGVYKSNAQQARLGGWLAGAGTLTGGLSNAYGTYKKYGRN